MVQYCESESHKDENCIAIFRVDWHGCAHKFLCIDCWGAVFIETAYVAKNNNIECDKCKRVFLDLDSFITEISMSEGEKL